MYDGLRGPIAMGGNDKTSRSGPGDMYCSDSRQIDLQHAIPSSIGPLQSASGVICRPNILLHSHSGQRFLLCLLLTYSTLSCRHARVRGAAIRLLLPAFLDLLPPPCPQTQATSRCASLALGRYDRYADFDCVSHSHSVPKPPTPPAGAKLNKHSCVITQDKVRPAPRAACAGP